MIIGMQNSSSVVSLMSADKKKDVERNYSDETFYTDTSDDIRSKCRSAATLLQKRRQLRPIIGTGSPYRNSTRLMTLSSPSKNNVSLIAQKIMSAKVLRVKQLQNELSDAQFQLNELSTENRLLRTLQKRQDMALKKYEGTQAELPQLIRSHNEEVRTLKTKLKQAKIQCRELESKLKIRETELLALKEQHKHLLKLSKDKHLGEREQLQLQLEQMQDLLKEQDKKVQMLTRKVMLEGKNYKHQLTTEISRHKTTAKELDLALDKIAQLESLVETKEKYIAANMPRMHNNNQSVSLVSLGPPARFRFYQPQMKLSDMNIPEVHNEDEGNIGGYDDEDVEVDVNNDDDDDDDDDELNEQRQKDLQQGQVQRHILQRQKVEIEIEEGEEERGEEGEEEEEEEEEDDDDEEDFEQDESSADSHTYTSQVSTCASMENFSRETRGNASESENKSHTSQKLRGKSRTLGTQSSFQTEMENALESITRPEKGTPARRFSVAGDSDVIPDDPNIAINRRNSLNGAGDTAKKGKDLSLMSVLVSEMDRQTFIRRNSLGKNYNPPDNYLPIANKDSSKKSVISLEQDNSSEIADSSLRNDEINMNDMLVSQESSIPTTDSTAHEMSVEEGRQRLKNINRTWDEIQSRIKEETNRAQSMMEKYDDELNDVEKLTCASESYNKKHLLAALKAIDNGADPIDLIDEVKERRNSVSGINKSKKGESRGLSQTIENLQKGIPNNVSISYEKSKKEHNQFWEDEASVYSNIVNKEIELPKTRPDIMQELFGGQKVESNFYIDSVTLSSTTTVADSTESVSPLRNRMQRK